jgi:hypothetical protein
MAAPPIIEAAEFEAVQALLKTAARPSLLRVSLAADTAHRHLLLRRLRQTR